MIDPRAFAAEVTEAEPGLWVAAADEAVSYPAWGHGEIGELAATSAWFRHRNACVLTLLRRWPPGGPLFDVGGGGGVVARALVAAGHEAVVVEPDAAGAGAAHASGLRPVVRATLRSGGFRDGTLPAAGLFDVLEHIEDDVGFLRDLAAVMAPGATLYATVPAYRWLWSADDEVSGHFRRYTRRSLERVVTEGGLSVVYLSHCFAILPLPILVARTIPSLVGLRRPGGRRWQREHRRPGGAAGRLLDRLFQRELRTLAAGRLRFGSTILLVARNV